MVHTWKALKKTYIVGQHFKFLFFWGHTPSADGLITEVCLSQWWKYSLTVDGAVYSCAEQFMMAEEARMLGDRNILGNTMEAREPKAMKTYGRAVKNFDKEIWDAACYELVREGNMARFSQNPELWEFLKSTRKRILTEASPRDRIWGIGMGRNSLDTECPLKWRGSSLLGLVSTEARDLLLEKEGGMD